MSVPKVVSTGVQVFSVHGNNFGMIPRDSIPPRTHPHENVWLVGQALCQLVDNGGTVNLKRNQNSNVRCQLLPPIIIITSLAKYGTHRHANNIPKHEAKDNRILGTGPVIHRLEGFLHTLHEFSIWRAQTL